MKFVQLLEYNVRKSFPGNTWTTCGGETSPRVFFKKSKLSTSLDKKFYSPIQCPSRGLTKHIETKKPTICFFSYKAFSKTKRGMELFSFPLFLHDF